MLQALLFLIVLNSILIGVFLILKPSSAISIQKKFYEAINWRIEPISMEKELRNTRIMGAFLIFLAFLCVFYLILT